MAQHFGRCGQDQINSNQLFMIDITSFLNMVSLQIQARLVEPGFLKLGMWSSMLVYSMYSLLQVQLPLFPINTGKISYSMGSHQLAKSQI
jgi:hypothetical protein